MSNEIRAMRLRRRSAALRAEPLRVSVLRTAAAIATGLIVFGLCFVIPAIFAGA